MASNEAIISAFNATGSCKKAGALIGVAHSTIHRRLVKLGLNNPQNRFRPEELDRLRADYETYANEGRLSALAEEMGRDKTTICGMAGNLGLTDPARKRPYFSESSSRNARDRIAKNGHPRGFAGRSHSTEAKSKISRTSRAMWSGMNDDERADFTMKQMKNKLAKHGTLAPVRTRGSWKAGWREIGGKRCFFRSRWEANYARYLELLKSKMLIEDWHHEPKTFWFESIKRGVRSYLPDFGVEEMDGRYTYHEVKGWMDSRSRTTISRFRKYYPEHELFVIDKAEYENIGFTVRREIADWEP